MHGEGKAVYPRIGGRGRGGGGEVSETKEAEEEQPKDNGGEREHEKEEQDDSGEDEAELYWWTIFDFEWQRIPAHEAGNGGHGQRRVAAFCG